MSDSKPDYKRYGKADGWLGWGRPAIFTMLQAEEHARKARALGRCGEVVCTTNLGVAVCDQEADECEDGHGHCDHRHQVVWGGRIAGLAE